MLFQRRNEIVGHVREVLLERHSVVTFVRGTGARPESRAIDFTSDQLRR